MDERLKKSICCYLDHAGLAVLGLLSLGYFVFGAVFAEKHVQFSFLNFPVFVGEIGIFMCLICVLLKFIVRPWAFNRWWWLLTAYFCFVLIKAFYGYSVWGPLAFRNAALLYYPVCAVMGFIFFDRRYFSGWKNIFLAVIIIYVLFSRVYYDYWIFTGIILALVLSSSCKTVWLRWGMFVATLIAVPYSGMFKSSRMTIVGNTLSSVSLLCGLVFIWSVPRKIKWVVVVSGILAISFCIYRYSDPKEICSLVNIKKMRAVYDHFESRYQTNKDQHVPFEFNKVQLYVPNRQNRKEYVEYRRKFKESKSLPHLSISTDEEQADTTIAGYKNDDSILPYNNSVYRLLVWRDVVEDYWEYKPILGMDFGKPFRSKRLEVGGWGGQWKLDGWVPVHNSLLHILYRTGIVGVGFILSVIGLYGWILKGFLRLRSFVGIALCSVFIYWGVCANFLLTLEFPYSAIPMWSLYGMMLTYYLELRREEGSSINVD